MTFEETCAVMDIFKTAYPNFYKNQTDKERIDATKLWAGMFSDDDPRTVTIAIKAFIATDKKGFPPVIGIIKNKIADIKKPDSMTEYEAWNIVKQAIGNGIYGASEEFEKLPPVLRRLVGSPNNLREWAQMESETVESVIGSNFMRSYRVRAEHEREQTLLPADVKKFMAALSEKMAMPNLPKQLTASEVNDRRNEFYDAYKAEEIQK